MESLNAQQVADMLIRQGYRRCSNKYRIVARIDRPDWINVLARHCRRSVAELFLEDGKPHDNPSPSWCGYYRSVLSKDHIEGVPQEVFRLIPHSSFDPCGFCPKE